VLPNLHGLLLIVILAASLLGSLLLFIALPGLGVAYRLLMLAGFVIMCAVWVLTVLLSGMKRYQAIVLLFGGSYALIVVLSLPAPLGLEGLAASSSATWSCSRHVAADRARLRRPRPLPALRFPASGTGLPDADGHRLLYNLRCGPTSSCSGTSRRPPSRSSAASAPR
jgi:hypothetical protein